MGDPYHMWTDLEFAVMGCKWEATYDGLEMEWIKDRVGGSLYLQATSQEHA